jgi:hypothetical protein
MRNMTIKDDKNSPLEKLRGSVLKYELPMEPAADESYWGGFFYSTLKASEDFTRGEQTRSESEEVNWDEVFNADGGDPG